MNKKFDLKSVVKANDGWKAQRIIISSVQGLGKSTFGATFEKPIFLRTEDGAGNLDVATFPDVVTNISEIEDAIKTLHVEKHDFRTLVIDSIDWLEPIIWAKQMEDEPESDKGLIVNDIEGYGYGKGFSKCLKWWRYLMGGFDSLRLKHNINIIMIAHTEVKRHEPPGSEPYDRYQIKLHKSASALWQEWADMVLFAGFDVSIRKTDTGFNKQKAHGVGSGNRILYTEERPSHIAKNRWGLEPEIYIGKDKSWNAFHENLHEVTQCRYNNKDSRGGNKSE